MGLAQISDETVTVEQRKHISHHRFRKGSLFDPSMQRNGFSRFTLFLFTQRHTIIETLKCTQPIFQRRYAVVFVDVFISLATFSVGMRKLFSKRIRAISSLSSEGCQGWVLRLKSMSDSIYFENSQHFPDPTLKYRSNAIAQVPTLYMWQHFLF